MIITQTFTLARWQIVIKKSEATKQNKDQNKNKQKRTTKNKNKTGERVKSNNAITKKSSN